MEQNLLIGFIMAGVAVLAAIFGCSFYCVFGIGCIKQPNESSSGDMPEMEATMAIAPPDGGIALSPDGNPAPPSETSFKNPPIEL
jgi:hypothetical protein